MRKYIVIIFILIFPYKALADVKLLRVYDGDTIEVMLDGVNEKIRIAEIDTPELCMPYSQKARSFLLNMCYAKEITIIAMSRDKYNRIVGKVLCGRQDVAEKLLAEGLAKVYTRFSNSPFLRKIEAAAKKKHKNIWKK